MVTETSLMAYIEEKESGKLDTRRNEVYSLLKKLNKPLTSREIMVELGYNEPNNVKPRITELKKANIISEYDKVKCKYTKKTVTRWTIKK
jgi:hypothetical protein